MSKSKKKKIEVSNMNNTTSEDSEYETLEEDNGGSSHSSASRRSSRHSSFSDQNNLSDDIGLEDEREDGDGQEENPLAKDKKLDDDEDRRNPQYIPKRGTFYEHDDRTAMDENGEESNGNDASRKEKPEESENEIKVGGLKKSKVWTEKADRWSHDLYVEDEQKPKSTQELIDTYGYDIRNEEAPPKARRRRRYGRGPNKYTRNWEDEDAYTRSMPSQRKVFHNNKEDFPDLGERKRRDKVPVKVQSPQDAQSPPPSAVERERTPRREREESNFIPPPERERVKPLPTVRETPAALPKVTFTKLPEKHSQPASNNFPPPPMVVGLTERHDRPDRQERERQERLDRREQPEQRVGRGRGFRGTGKPRPVLEFTASRGRAALPTFSREQPPVTQAVVPDSLKHAADMLIQDFSHVYINNNNNTNNIVEETIIPRSERRSQHSGGEPHAGGESTSGGGRSKRYSTQRQRSLPETTPPPTYSPPHTHTIPYYTQPPPTTGYVAAPVYNEVAAPAVTSPPMQMVAFLPPGPPPTGTAAPPYPPPPLLNYLPPPSFPPMALQPPLAGQFEDLTQGAELYQGQSGITYYSPQSQSAVPRATPVRRVKLAIPIVPPPDKTGANKRGSGKQQEVQSIAS